MNGDTSAAFPSKQDDQPGMTMLVYFAAHAPFSLDDVPVTREVNGATVDLSDIDRMEILVTMRFSYAARMMRRARGRE